MRILVINYEYPPLGGGGGHRSQYIAREYARENDVYFLTAGWDSFGISSECGFTVQKLDTGRKRLHICTSPEMLRFVVKGWSALGELLRTRQFDVVHIFFGVPTGLLIFHPALRKTPCVVWLCGSDVPWHNKERFWFLYIFFTPIIKLIWSRATALVCNSSRLRNEARQFTDAALKVIPNGVNTDLFRPLPGPRHEGPLIVLYAGRLVAMKQVDAAVRAVAKARAAGAELRLRIAGDGPDREELRKLAARLGIADTEFLGNLPREKMPEQYCAADVFIFTSRNEGMSNSVLEAMACGLPVLTTPAGGSPDLINGNGSIIDDPESDDFARELARYAKDRELLARHGARSLEIAGELSWSKVARMHLSIAGGSR